MNQRITCLAILAVASLAASGCGADSPARVPVFPVEGAIQFGGRPAANLIVQFHPSSPKPLTTGSPDVASIATETDAEGRYRLSTYIADDGAPAGDYVVTFRPGGLPDLDGGDGLPRVGSVEEEALTKYVDVDTSPFKATIKPGDNRFDYDLE